MGRKLVKIPQHMLEKFIGDRPFTDGRVTHCTYVNTSADYPYSGKRQAERAKRRQERSAAKLAAKAE